jgi:hypothetical protein
MLAAATEFAAAASLVVAGAQEPGPARELVEKAGSVIIIALGIAFGLSLAAAYIPGALRLYPAYQAENPPGRTRTGVSSALSGETMGIVLPLLAIIAPVIASAFGIIIIACNGASPH